MVDEFIKCLRDAAWTTVLQYMTSLQVGRHVETISDEYVSPISLSLISAPQKRPNTCSSYRLIG